MGMYHTYDCVLIHTPKFNHYFHPLNRVGFVNIMASGLLSMADIIARNGYRVRVFHLGVEVLKNPRIDFEEFFKRVNSKVFGLSLQWHYQLYDTLRVAEIIRKVQPGAFIVLGGITASYFCEEIMDRFDYIDAIVKGEGEIPILRLVKEVTDKRYSFEGVPNLVYRRGRDIIHNPQTYTASDEELSSLSFTDLSYLESYERYTGIHFFTKYDRSRINHIYKFLSNWLSPPTYIVTGRGCPYSCSFCAGGYNFKNILKRDAVGIKSVESVLVDIEKFFSRGIKRVVSAHYYDGYRDYYTELIRRTASEFKDLRINFDCWGIPTKDIIEAFSALNRESTMLFLIYHLSEKIRRLNRIHSFTNDELFSAISFAKKKRVRVKILLMDNLPFENDDRREIQITKRELYKRGGRLLNFSLPTEIVPGSPMFLNPERFGIINSLVTFDDFYNYSKKAYFTAGYHFENMSEREMQLIKCRESCLINPVYGRLICKILHKITK